MSLTCPSCQNAIDPGGSSADQEVVCAVCGSSVRPACDVTVSAAPVARERRIGRFAIERRVGVGAFGAVFRARAVMLGRAVAVKVPHLADLAGPQAAERFMGEARSAAQLHHPGIVPVHEVGYADGAPYLVSEFVDGVTLADRLTAGPVPPREAAAVAAAIADALGYAHARGVVHRDVKPSNIMLTPDGRPRLMDFGMAKRDAGEETMTTDGQVLGTPAYIGPEQARGEARLVDGRSDVYSAGVVLYQLLTGELPFRGNGRMVLHQVIHEPPRPPRQLDDRVPRDLEKVCLKAMSKEPAHRYATAGELADDLRRFVDGLPVRARPAGFLACAWLWCHRADRVREAGALAIFVGVVLMAWAGYEMVYYAWAANVARPAEAVVTRLALAAGLFGPLVFIGVRTLRHSPAALCAGVLLPLLGLGFVVAFAQQDRLGIDLQFGGSYAAASARMPIVSLFGILCTILALAYAIALAAYRSNRNVMRWSRDGGDGGSDGRPPGSTRTGP